MRIFWHPTSLEHDPGPGHPESPARLRAILDEFHRPDVGVRLEWSEAPSASRKQLLRAHPADYVDGLHAFSDQGGGPIDRDTSAGPVTFAAACHAAGAAVGVACSAIAGEPAFAAVRPPGHHATASTAMGFCFINNVVVAALAALEEAGAVRVLIVDWDVHHGNGTQDLVARDERIRYVSLHQWPLYPGTGREEERGVGNIFNVPRPPGLPPERYRGDLDDAVNRAIAGWQPDLILISAGFDAMAGDPLAGFTLEPGDYATWVRGWRQIGAPMGAVLEGGYVPDRIRLAAAETVRALA